MKKHLLIALATTLILSACGSSSDSGGIVARPAPAPEPEDYQINIITNNVTQTVDYTDAIYDLNITSSTSNITIAALNEIDRLTLVGSNNLVTITDCVNGIAYISVTGNDNTFYYPQADCTFAFDSQTGINNQIVGY